MNRRPQNRVSARHSSLQLLVACTALACVTASGCKSPWGWWGGGSSGGMFSSATPDVSKQRYDGLSQDYSGVNSAYKAPTAANENYLTSTWKKSTAAVGSAFTWKTTTESEDPTSLDSKPKTVGPDVYIAAGRMYETQGKFSDALGQYEKALKASPNDLASLISIARLHDRQGNFPKAMEAYQRAAKAHPKSGLVQNDMGLCYNRQRDHNRAVESLARACEFSPKNPKYRNNLATVLVEAGRTEEAFKQLNVLNSEGVAHYNLAYLLTARGRQAEAVQHLQLAVQAEPNLVAARELLAQMGQPMQGQVGPPSAQPPFVQVADQQPGPNVPPNPAPGYVPRGNPFQNVSTNNPVEITFPTAPANGTLPGVPGATSSAASPAQATGDDASFRIGDEEGPQLLPPVVE